MGEAPLAPGATIGILGGGQLGRMLAIAAAELGLRCHVYSDDPKAPAFDVAAAKTHASFDDQSQLVKFANVVSVATVEFENVPAATLSTVSDHVPVYPSPTVLAISQDRLSEKEFLRQNGIAVAPYRPVESPKELSKSLEAIGYPALLKTRRFGYDGKGQFRIESELDIEQAVDALAAGPMLIEAVIDFVRELSVVLVRDRTGATRIYDPSENTHHSQILTRSIVPAGASSSVLNAARQIAEEIARQLEFVGAMCVEFFECGDQTLLVNEIAPRVHNSGHWTLDACLVSQFENHMRAVAGWPLGGTDRHSNAEMLNLIGDEVAQWGNWAADQQTAVHLYGKEEVRAGRKMGHITRLTPMTGAT